MAPVRRTSSAAVERRRRREAAKRRHVDGSAFFTGPWRPNGALILAAAIAAVDDKGPESLRVEQLVDDIGLTIPEIYRHFGSRQGLIDAVQAERFARTLDEDRRMVDVMVDTATSAEAFRTGLLSFLVEVLGPERHANRWRRVNVLGSAYGSEPLLEDLRSILRRFDQTLIDALERARARGLILADADVESLLVWFTSISALGRALDHLDVRRRFDEDRVVMYTVDVVSRELFGEPAPAITELRRPV